MTEQELAAAVSLISGDSVSFRYYARTKKGKATSTWAMHHVLGGKESTFALKHANGPTKVKAWEEMEVAALAWADNRVKIKEYLRNLRVKRRI